MLWQGMGLSGRLPFLKNHRFVAFELGISVASTLQGETLRLLDNLGLF